MPGLLDFLGLGGGPTYTQDGQPVAPQGLLGGFGRGLQNNSDSLMGFGMGMLSGGRESGWANALQGMQRGELLDRTSAKDKLEQAQLAAKRKAAADWIAANPAAAKYAPLLNSNPELADKFATAQFQKQLNPDNPLDDEVKRAQIEKMKREAAGGNAQFGLTPLYGEKTMPDGTKVTVPLQMSNQGGIRESALPPGMTLNKGYDKVDAGTHYILIDKLTRQPVGTLPKNLDAAAAAEVEGKAAGQARVNLPDATATTDRMLTQIEEAKAHPGKYWGTGMTSALNNLPGTDQFDFQQRVNQIKGGTFLQAYNTLRGAGAITDIEGKKAEDAIARLNTGLRGKDFDTALDDLADVLKAGKIRMAQKAGVAPVQPPQGVPPTAPGQPPKRIRYDANGEPM